MEKVNLNKVAESCRPDLRIIGGTLGTQFFKPEARAAMLDFDKRKLEVERGGNVDLILNRTPRRFRVVGYDVLSVQLTNGALGEAKVVLNKDTDNEVSVAISADGKTFSNVTEDALNKALTGDKNIIFADAKKLIEQVNILNYDEKERLTRLREEINKAIAQVDSAINENNKKSEEYYAQLLKGSNPEDAATPVVVSLPGKSAPASKEVIVVTE